MNTHKKPAPAGPEPEDEMPCPCGKCGGGDEETLEAVPVAEEDLPSGAVKELEEKLQEGEDRYLRLAADFENYRKRQLRERAEHAKSANEALVIELLPVVDNLERAISAAGEGEAADGLRKGVELTLRVFKSTLAKFGVERMEAKGQVFDPHRHEAVGQDTAEGVEPDTVTEEVQAGYMLHGKVVRPARVRIARPQASSEVIEAEEKKEEEQ